MADYNDFLSTLKGGIQDFAFKNWKEHLEAVVSDGTEFTKKAEDDLKRWTALLAEGRISQDDFEWLVKGKKDLAEMMALKQLGLTHVAVDKCRNDLVDLDIKTAFKVFS